VCDLRLTSRLGLSSWAAMYPHRWGMKPVKLLKLFLCHSHVSSINSQYGTVHYTDTLYTTKSYDLCIQLYRDTRVP
jgi:hypothetical protein